MLKTWKKSIDKLKEIATLRRIESSNKLKKESLIISLLKSESSNAEGNYIKHFSDNTNDDKNNNNNNTNDDSYDGEIRDKISDIRMILSRFGNAITSNDRKKIKKNFMK